jgi:hypothetical protein
MNKKFCSIANPSNTEAHLVVISNLVAEADLIYFRANMNYNSPEESQPETHKN